MTYLLGRAGLAGIYTWEEFTKLRDALQLADFDRSILANVAGLNSANFKSFMKKVGHGLKKGIVGLGKAVKFTEKHILPLVAADTNDLYTNYN